ncbi:50S ribosomal protein L21 [Rhodosalinus sp.]|uniref:50S ribosomal protein L21 n=1 Tax=Rhodosalinus sp. TaxID=2047741 RepID=UPI00356865B0
MFAVMKTGGKQYRVEPGDTLEIEKLAAEAGDTVQFNEVLMLGGDSPQVGAPTVEGAAVQAEVLGQVKGPKVINFVRRRRKHSSKRTKGHRQQLTMVKVTEILGSGADATGVQAAVGAGKAPRTAGTAETAPKAKATAPAGGDDLTKLSGVGPKLAEKLQGAGVTSFAQIAAWTEEDIVALDEQLSIRGRIEREGWIDQARALAAEKE